MFSESLIKIAVKIYNSNIGKIFHLRNIKENLEKTLSKPISIYYSKKTLKKIQPLNKAYVTDKLSLETIHKYNYGQYYKLIETHPELYSKLYQDIVEYQTNSLSSNTKIRIGFYIYSSSMWSCDELYNLLSRNPCYDPWIIVVGYSYFMREPERMELYNSTIKYFREKQYNVIGSYDYQESPSPWTELGIDILVLLTPYDIMTPKTFALSNIPLNIPIYYIHYGLSVTDSSELWNAYNFPGMLISEKYFCDSKKYLETYSKKSITNGMNCIYTGHPKMDTFYNKSSEHDIKTIWKISSDVDNSDNVSKIIYAPHYSIWDAGIQFSTFDQNYQFVYQYAKEHPSTTSWIIKPHPHLKETSVYKGLFKNDEEYENYMNMWDALPNARVIRNGTYFNEFKTSDGIILDSSSFLIEYQYTGKPMLYLRRPTQVFAPLAKELLEVIYTANGDDTEAIKRFIDEVLINKNDRLIDKRKAFFEKNLDYVHDHSGLLASESIYNYFNEKYLENRNI